MKILFYDTQNYDRESSTEQKSSFRKLKWSI